MLARQVRELQLARIGLWPLRRTVASVMALAALGTGATVIAALAGVAVDTLLGPNPVPGLMVIAAVVARSTRIEHLELDRDADQISGVRLDTSIADRLARAEPWWRRLPHPWRTRPGWALRLRASRSFHARLTGGSSAGT